MPWLVPIVAAVAGGAISANATKTAQNKANDLAAKQQQDQLAQQMQLYLMQRGINPGTIAGLGGTAGGSVNTILPLSANVGGAPAEQAILNAIFGRSGLSTASPDTYASEQNIDAFFAAHPEVLQEITDNMAGSSDTRTPTQWLRDHVTQTESSVGGGRFTNYLKDFAQQQVTGDGTGAGTGTASGTLPPEITAFNNAAMGSLNKVYNGGFLNDERAALDDISKARLDLANGLAGRNTELRGGLKNILDTGLGGLDSILGARRTAADDILKTQLGGLDTVLGNRRTAANDILSTELSGLANLRGVGESGARSINQAELGMADTYENAVKQAVSRSLESNRAARALRGFSGDSSADALMRARTLAGGYQQAGGVRAQAGINLENLLNQYRREEAGGQLTSRSKSATSLGDASVQDALARLAANTGNATSRGSALELDALGRSSANNNYATGMAGILDSDVQKAIDQANLLNAGDRASLVGGDITRQLGSIGLGNNLYGSTLNLTNQAANAKYADLNALMGSLGFFRQNQPQAPNIQQPNIQPTLNSGQIFGSALSGIGGGLSNYMNNQQLIAAIGGRNRSPSTSGSSAGDMESYMNNFYGT